MADGDPVAAAATGVGGWLALLLLVLAVFRPLALLVWAYANLYGDPNVALYFGAAWVSLQLFEWLLAAATIGGCWYLAWRLNRRLVRGTVPIAIAGIWIVALGYQLVETIGIALIGNIPFGLMFGAATTALVQAVIFSLIWTAYFLLSKRVARTYPRHGEAEIADVFG